MKIKNITLLASLLLAAGMAGTQSSRAAEPTNTITLHNDITNSTTWYNTNVYLMDGFIHVLAPAELTIQPGTIIKGLSAGNITTGESASAFFITAGAKIYATGTPAQPIIFTTEFDDISVAGDMGICERGLWGGVVVCGNAVLNTSSSTAGNTNSPKYDVFEGSPDNQINGQFVYHFGGSNDADNSGEIQYVSIRHGGYAFLANKELNGLSMCALGSNTVIDHVEAYAIADDGFEWFGGTVNTKYLVSAFNDDDTFDTDQGYRGKNQFWFSIQEEGKRDNGGEWNGEPNGIAVSNAPIANFQLYNATFIGAGNGGTNTAANHGLTIREYLSPRVYNSILTDFTTAHANGSVGLNISDVRSEAMLTAGLMDLRENIIAGFGTAVTNTRSAILLADASRNNSTADPLLSSVSRVNDHTLDPRLATNSPALATTIVAPDDGFYTPVSYKGAFDTRSLWARTWTALESLGYLPCDTVITPPASLAAPNPVTLHVTPSGGNVEIRHDSQFGFTYQLQSAVSLAAPIAWVGEGAAQPGTGGTLSNTVPATETRKYFRVLAR